MKIPPQDKAFSLIEILVAVAIIVILAALSLPAMRAARNAANAGKCTSNLRQIYNLAATWAVDNDGYVPQARWHDENLPSQYKGGNLVKLGLTKEMTVCPSSGLKAPSYGLSTRLVVDGTPQWGPGDIYYYVRGKYKLGLLSPRTILFSETGKQAWSGQAGAYVSDTASASTPHSGRGNVLFADGHIEMWDTVELKKTANWTKGIP